MLLRSFLFVPGDKDQLFDKAITSGADAIIFDLEDAVRDERKGDARSLVFQYLQSRRRTSTSVKLFVRVNPVASKHIDADLDSICCSQIDGFVLPKCEGPEDVRSLLCKLRRLRDVSPSLKILAIAGETARGVLRLCRFAEDCDISTRLLGLSWGPYDLGADLGYSSSETDDLDSDKTLGLAQSLCLLAAKSLGTLSIDTVYSDFGDLDGLRTQCADLRRRGWDGKLAIHPSQIEIINDNFLPTADEVRRAEVILAAFRGNTDGAVAIDRQMIDQPHLRRAHRVLALANAYLNAEQSRGGT